MKAEKQNQSQPLPASGGRNTLWSREKTGQLIELYKKNDCLWNHWNESYKSKDKRNKAIENICSTLNISKFDFGKKVHNLRNQFNTEMKKLEQRLEAGGGETVDEETSSQSIRCKWSHFESLMFLRNVIEPRPGGYQSTFQPPKKMRLRFDYNSAEDDVNVTMLPAAANTNDDISHQYQYEENNEETPNEDFHQLENELNEVVGHTVQQREETMDQKYLPPIQQQNMSNVRTNAQKKTPHTVLHSPIATSSTGPSGAHIEITNINTDSSSTMELNSNNLAIISTNPTLITSSSTTSPAIPCCVSATTATPIISSVASVGSNPNPNIITTSSPSLSTACTRDQWDSFGELVATEFRNLNSDISRKKLKRKIMQAMLEVGEEDDYL